MGNPWRGEVDIEIDGRVWPARLSLGALAELEAALGAGSLVALAERFETGGYSARDVLAVLLAGLRAAGWAGDAAALGRAEIGGGPVGAARAAAGLLARAFALPEEAGR